MIYVVKEGKIVTNGSHEELLLNSEIYKNFYEKQLKKS
jgi:subfamily B ATP-binding cassette protein MsbA